MLHDKYFGPRGFVSLVYCLSYGENESLCGKVIDKTNKGTPQFWTLFAACARGVEHVAGTKANKAFSSPFASDLLKGGDLPVEERLKAKLEVLEDLRSRGIWLLDASIFGWYMSQPHEYSRSSSSGEVHRKRKNRPPKELKIPSLVLSWVSFTKHLIREVANEGHLKVRLCHTCLASLFVAFIWICSISFHLSPSFHSSPIVAFCCFPFDCHVDSLSVVEKLLIPIGMEVEAALTRERMEDAVRGESMASVSETFPAPNAWIPGGYGRFHAKLAALVNEAAPKVDRNMKQEL
jgi:hypothetical protein